MWPLCVPALSLRACMSSIMRRSTKDNRVEVTSGATKGEMGEDLSDVSMREPRVLAAIASPDVRDGLWKIIDGRKGADPGTSHSARLLARGTPQVVQKLGEELV